MLKRAFGDSAIAVRVNGAGQGDYFQVHVDTHYLKLESVKDFIRQAIYRRFGLEPEQDFVEPHSGGGAVGVKLSRAGDLLKLFPVEFLRIQPFVHCVPDNADGGPHFVADIASKLDFPCQRSLKARKATFNGTGKRAQFIGGITLGKTRRDIVVSEKFDF